MLRKYSSAAPKQQWEPFPPGGGADARDPGIRTILFTDIVNSILTHRYDDAALAILGVHDAIVQMRWARWRARGEAPGTNHGTFFRQRARCDAQFRFSWN